MGMPYNGNDSVYAVNMPSGITPRIGSKNIKARYIEYTDSSFSTPKPVSADWLHLGILGPVIRANVGDSVVVFFKNKTSINTSIHVHGLLYDASSEGATYNNGSTGNGNSIAPGGKYMYRYYAREGSGPVASQPSSVVWIYHSHVNMDESDLYAGLVGAIIVNRKGVGDDNAKASDIDREFVTLFMIFDENHSALLDKNIQNYCQGFTNPSPDDFEESNKKHAINGMFMGNLPGLIMKKGL
jgi:FtsP/CotA-like multicopper oxidase with cupredoxin domain